MRVGIRMGCLGWLIFGPFILIGYAAYLAVVTTIWLLRLTALVLTAWSEQHDRKQLRQRQEAGRPRWPDSPRYR